jgi:pimeloyl-ACP methyl ester carboxylesterase
MYYEARTFTEADNLQRQKQIQIPCLYHEYIETSNNFILYFHGNAEDIGYAAEFTKRLSTGLKANVLAVEYPGYGIYEGETSAETIIEDAEIVFDFLTQELGIKSENIFVFGRSIGSGPATHLAANRNPGMLILIPHIRQLGMPLKILLEIGLHIWSLKDSKILKK